MLSLFDHRGATMRPRTLRLATVVALLVCCSPVLVLVLQGWGNASLYVASILSIVLLLRIDFGNEPLMRRQRHVVSAVEIAMAAPFLTVAFAALLRLDPYPSQFDAPARMCMAIPIFVFVLRSGLGVGRTMQWVLPVALVVAFGYLQVLGPDPKWPPERQTTRIADPLVFGYFTLTFGLMCLVSISPMEWRGGARWGVLLRAAAAVLGVYLSVQSGSRTGWAAVPIVVGVWLHHHWGRGHRLATAACILGAALLPVVFYLLVPSVEARIDQLIDEYAEYARQGIHLQRQYSLGMRIAFLEIAGSLFAQHPWAGWGDTAYEYPAPLGDFAPIPEWVVKGAYDNAFHNQFVTNAVRAGIPGLLGTAAMLLVPLWICAQGLRRAPPGDGKDSAMGMAFFTCMTVSAMTTEIVDLKYAASLYSVMAAIMTAGALARLDEATAGD